MDEFKVLAKFLLAALVFCLVVWTVHGIALGLQEQRQVQELTGHP